MIRDLAAAPVAPEARGLPDGFEAHSTEVVVRGLCSACAAADGPAPAVMARA